jgi:hypothetical protein
MSAYSYGKFCALDLNGVQAKASLVDISAGGARLRLTAPMQTKPSGLVLVSVLDVDDKGALKNLRGQIRWSTGQELGVKFDTALIIGLSDLQRLVC